MAQTRLTDASIATMPAASSDAPKKKVVVISALARPTVARLTPLRDAGLDIIERYDLNGSKDDSFLSRELRDAWATVAGSEQYDAGLFEALSSLRAIARCGAGYDMIDIRAATDHGVAIMTTPGANADGVADHALALMLSCVRRLPDMDRSVRSGTWRPDGLTGDLSRATVGIIGLGPIGRAVVRRLRGFECRILASDPFADETFCRAEKIELLDLGSLLPQVDILTIHAPLTPATRHLISGRELALMRPASILINTSRGELVDQDALATALKSGTLAGAGLDVFEREPPRSDDAILALSNVVVTPHVAGFSRGAAQNTMDMVTRNLLSILAGELPESCLNRKELTERGGTPFR
jgi:D-3-phosphoglycerate dehydrogenase / 2-oxoglutarate reductase